MLLLFSLVFFFLSEKREFSSFCEAKHRSSRIFALVTTVLLYCVSYRETVSRRFGSLTTFSPMREEGRIMKKKHAHNVHWRFSLKAQNILLCYTMCLTLFFLVHSTISITLKGEEQSRGISSECAPLLKRRERTKAH